MELINLFYPNHLSNSHSPIKYSIICILHNINVILPEIKAHIVASLITARHNVMKSNLPHQQLVIFTLIASSMLAVASCHEWNGLHSALPSERNEDYRVRRPEFSVALEYVATLRLVALRWSSSLTSEVDLHLMSSPLTEMMHCMVC